MLSRLRGVSCVCAQAPGLLSLWKPVCAKCRIHCYRAGEKAFAREVMRHAGPRLLLAHPVLSLRHLVKSLTVKAPEKPRNRTKTGKTNG